MRFSRIPGYVSDETLSTVRVVITDEPPKPPMKEFGFSGVDAQLDGMAFGELEMRGATLDQLFFINPRAVSDEQFPFHQVVHSLQWRMLGREAWLKSYGFGVLTCGRANAWAEIQAGRLQGMFANSELFDAEKIVRDEAELLKMKLQQGFITVARIMPLRY